MFPLGNRLLLFEHVAYNKAHVVTLIQPLLLQDQSSNHRFLLPSSKYPKRLTKNREVAVKDLAALLTIQLISRDLIACLTKSHCLQLISCSVSTTLLVSHLQSQILPRKEHFSPTASIG